MTGEFGQFSADGETGTFASGGEANAWVPVWDEAAATMREYGDQTEVSFFYVATPNGDERMPVARARHG
jgi:hypothetical protein